MTQPIITNQLREKIKRGDRLSDNELDIGVAFFKQLAASLACMGSLYHLTWNDAHRNYLRLLDYQIAREEKSISR